MHRVECRRAKVEDIDWLVDQLRQFSQFYKTNPPLFTNEQFVKAGLVELIAKHVMIVAESNQAPIGFIGGSLGPHTFNPSVVVLAELFWWVQEEYRQSRAGFLLLKEFMDFGKANATWVTMCLIEGRSPIKEQSLIKRGFSLYERSYLFEVSA